MPVFGLLKRGGQVHAVMIPNVQGATVMPIIRRRVRPDAIVYSDGYFCYRALDVSEFRHVRIDKPRATSRAAPTSTASRISGARPSDTCAATMAFLARPSRCSWPNANGASTTRHRQTCSEFSMPGQA